MTKVWGHMQDVPVLLRQWFSHADVEELDMPAQSPELKPIQHLFGWTVTLAASVTDLTNPLAAECEQTSTVSCNNLVEALLEEWRLNLNVM